MIDEAANLVKSKMAKRVFSTYKAGCLRMTVLEWTDSWEEAERRWIKQERARRPGRLFNIGEGGK